MLHALTTLVWGLEIGRSRARRYTVNRRSRWRVVELVLASSTGIAVGLGRPTTRFTS